MVQCGCEVFVPRRETLYDFVKNELSGKIRIYLYQDRTLIFPVRFLQTPDLFKQFSSHFLSV